MSRMVIFGLGYTASRIAAALRERGWQVDATGSAGNLDFDDEPAIRAALANVTHVLSSVPPFENSDPVLDRYNNALKRGWTGYLSSTGVYGDTGGAWVDESAPAGLGRRAARADCDQRWLDKGAHVFRLPGIYGPGRNPLERVRDGKAKRINVPGQLFNRIHVDDIISSVLASFTGPAGVFNITDDVPAAQHEVLAYAARLLGIEAPPLISLEDANLSKVAMGFYEENRKVTNGKAKRELNWQPQFTDYKMGLSDLLD